VREVVETGDENFEYLLRLTKGEGIDYSYQFGVWLCSIECLISPTRPLDSSNLAPKHYIASLHPSTRDGLIPLNSNMDLRNDDDGKG
jgi:hypothetical protein